jgi:hypothetical protein
MGILDSFKKIAKDIPGVNQIPGIKDGKGAKFTSYDYYMGFVDGIAPENRDIMIQAMIAIAFGIILDIILSKI